MGEAGGQTLIDSDYDMEVGDGKRKTKRRGGERELAVVQHFSQTSAIRKFPLTGVMAHRRRFESWRISILQGMVTEYSKSVAPLLLALFIERGAGDIIPIMWRVFGPCYTVR